MNTGISCEETVAMLIVRETRLNEMETKAGKAFNSQEQKTTKECHNRKKEAFGQGWFGQRNIHEKIMKTMERTSEHVTNAARRIMLLELP